MTTINQIARAIAEGLGDDFDRAFASKSDWIDARGESGGRFRDINEPFQIDYLEAARAVLAAMLEPNEATLEAGSYEAARLDTADASPSETAEQIFTVMIQHILNGTGE